MSNTVRMPENISKLPAHHSSKLQWFLEEAAKIRLDRECKRIDYHTAKQKLDVLLVDRRSFWQKLFGM